MMRTMAPIAPLAVALLGTHVLAPSTTLRTPPPPNPIVGTASLTAPAPLLKLGQPVDWWFVFKFNARSFPECGGIVDRSCRFGGTVQDYPHFSQQFAFASSIDRKLQQGGGCVGDGTSDPVGATFDQVYNGQFSYVVWNDQFDGDP